MKILSMTATFGKLEHQTLDLREGLNVIEAPNEWGKSTWCAFLVAMFYGISTSSRTKKDFLADKERYAPWSGRPMTGRIELVWQGRAITIERSPRGKIPFGTFRAYETDTNVDVPELTGENCGAVLLGVEQEVFTRAGFLRGSDLPVVEGEALRRRLNALVTTGDESGASDALAQKLKKLKNDCRFNRTGLLPQAEQQRAALLEKLTQLQALKEQTVQLKEQETALTEYAEQLENHRVALTYAHSLQTREHVRKAEAAAADAQAKLRELENRCGDLPTAQTAKQELERLRQAEQQMLRLQEENELPPMPQKPETPAPFAGKDPAGALQQANSDSSAYKMLCKPVTPVLLILACVLGVLALAGLAFMEWFVCVPVLLLGVLLAIFYVRNRKAQVRDRQAVAGRYGNEQPDSWVALAQAYAASVAGYEKQLADYESKAAAALAQKTALDQTLQLLTQGKTLSQSLAYWQQVLSLRQDWEDARLRYEHAQAHAKTVSDLVQTAPAPKKADTLTLSGQQTEQESRQAAMELQRVRQQLTRCEAQMEGLGSQKELEQELTRVCERLSRLEDLYAALTMAQQTLTQAATELQRRFAPRISARAKELFGRLTGGRYDRLLLASDFSMEVAAQDEDTTHGVLWRSDGTVDQLYLALRLAVAEELTPHAPLVLDDAFVRFDETRLAAAMQILKDYAKDKQVILFTCQEREKKYQE